MTTASTQRTGADGVQAGQRDFVAHQATDSHEPNHSDNPPVLFRLPDLSSAQVQGPDWRAESESPPQDGADRSEAMLHHSEIPNDPPPAPQNAAFPPPPVTAPSAAGDDFPPPPAHPSAQSFGASSDGARRGGVVESDGYPASSAAETTVPDRQSKSVRQPTSAVPAGRNWMETIGSRLLLLLLLAAVAAAAILAGRGTNPADDMRLAGKPEDLLAELGVQTGAPTSPSSTSQEVAEMANDDVVEPPLSYEDFIARTQAEEQADAEQPTDGKREGADSQEPVTKASDILDMDLSLTDPNLANTSPSDRKELSNRDRSAAKETEAVGAAEESTYGETATPFVNADTRDDADAEESTPRLAEAPTKDERSRVAITEPRSISEPRTNQLFEPETRGTEADSDFDLPINPYDENPYVAERASETPTQNTGMLSGSSDSGSSAESNRLNEASPPRYDRTEMDQGVDWESLLPTNQPAYQAPPPSNGVPGRGPSHFEPQDGGLQPPANSPQQMQRDFAGPISSQGAAYPDPGTANDPRGFAGQPGGNQGHPGNQRYGGNPGYGGNQGYPENQNYAGNQGHPGNQSYGENRGYNQGYGGNQSYGGNEGYGGLDPAYAPAHGMAAANQPSNPQAGQMSQGYPRPHSSPANGYTGPQGGGFSPYGDGQSATQQAVSPYDAPRR